MCIIQETLKFYKSIISVSKNAINVKFSEIFFSTLTHEEKTECMVKMSVKPFTKVVKFITPESGV